jgi:hypothetical protein
MQPIGHERDRSKDQTAHDFGTHHRATKPNHRPSLTLTLFVLLAEKNVLMKWGLDGVGIKGHDNTHFK